MGEVIEVRVSYRDDTCEIRAAADVGQVRELLNGIERRCAEERKKYPISHYVWKRSWIDAVTVVRGGEIIVTEKIENNDTGPIGSMLCLIDRRERVREVLRKAQDGIMSEDQARRAIDEVMP